MSDVQIAVIDQQNTEVTVAVPGIQGIQGQTGDVAVAQDGTAGTPGIRFENDTNTGIYRPGADQLALSTNGAGRLFVDANGLIGVNTSSPNASLTVQGGSAAMRYRTGSATDGRFEFAYNTTDVGYIGIPDSTTFSVIARTGNALQLGAGGSEKLRITSAGLVGIGTSSPSFATHINAAKNTSQLFVGITGLTSVDDYAQIGLGSGSISYGSLRLGFDNPAGVTNTYLSFHNNNGSSNVERMRIDSSGRVGIGTTSPQVNLHLKDATNPRLRFEQDNTSVQQQIESSNAVLVFTSDVTNVANGGFVFKDGVDERARIDGSGRLLVGTSSDSGGALLQVNGDRIRVATAKTPASASDTGTTGEICWDASYVYVCTATNTWKRAALSTW